jgi:polyhydroxybutyrate depolymerase
LKLGGGTPIAGALGMTVRAVMALAVAVAAFLSGTHIADANQWQPASVMPVGPTLPAGVSLQGVQVSVRTIQVGSTTRSYEQFLPAAALSKSAPLIVVLSGSGATLSLETGRDDLIPYAKAGKAELIYPVDYKQSWNAGGCCQQAASQNVNDVGFIKQLVTTLDPGHQRPVYLVGYSNGARLAYRFACSDPGVFDAIAAVKGDPEPGCNVTDPQDILQIAALDDDYVPYKPGEKGQESPAATVENARLRSEDKCSGAGTTTHPGSTLALTSWTNCADGTRLEFAVYSTGAHGFPAASSTQPAAAQVIWAFFTNQTTIAPVPK